MDVEALHVTLQQSFSPDASLRDPAEERIRNLKHVKGATVMLLLVVSEKQVCLTSSPNTLRQQEIYSAQYFMSHNCLFDNCRSSMKFDKLLLFS